MQAVLKGDGSSHTEDGAGQDASD